MAACFNIASHAIRVHSRNGGIAGKLARRQADISDGCENSAEYHHVCSNVAFVKFLRMLILLLCLNIKEKWWVSGWCHTFEVECLLLPHVVDVECEPDVLRMLSLYSYV